MTLISTVALSAVAVFLSVPSDATVGEFDPMAGRLERDAVAAVASGNYSSDQWRLVSSDPDLAAITPDPRTSSKIGVKSLDGDEMKVSDRAVVGAKCRKGTPVGYRVHFTKKSLTGLKLFTYEQNVGVCRTFWNKKITSRYRLYDDVKPGPYSGVQVGNQIIRRGEGVGSDTFRSYTKRQLSICVIAKGCYAYPKPWIKASIKAYDGSIEWKKGM